MILLLIVIIFCVLLCFVGVFFVVLKIVVEFILLWWVEKIFGRFVVVYEEFVEVCVVVFGF